MHMASQIRYTTILSFFFALVCSSQDNGKIQPLQPFFATEIHHIVSQPSDITYCATTGHLYVVGDTRNYIYEFDPECNYVKKWQFSSKIHDVEAVACNAKDNEILLVEEGRHIVHRFLLPINHNWYPGNVLIPLDSFVIQTNHSDSQSGIEGLTVDSKRDLIYAVNEKRPKIFITLTLDGILLDATYPDFSGDLSGACYDEVLDRVWLVSDISERIYVTDITGMNIYDFWDLPVSNPEGIALNNDHDPPLLYIVTDPSAPHGVEYVSAIFVFTKPELGTGLAFYDPERPPPYPPVECQGCDTIQQIIEEHEQSQLEEERKRTITIALATTSSVLFSGLIVLMFFLVVGAFRVPIFRLGVKVKNGVVESWKRYKDSDSSEDRRMLSESFDEEEEDSGQNNTELDL